MSLAGPWKRPGGGGGGGGGGSGKAGAGSQDGEGTGKMGALRRRLIITAVYLHNLMSPVNPAAVFGRLLLYADVTVLPQWGLN